MNVIQKVKSVSILSHIRNIILVCYAIVTSLELASVVLTVR